MDFSRISQTTVFHGHAFDVDLVDVLLPDGKIKTYDLVCHLPSIVIVPVDHFGNIWFVRQYRVGVQESLLELPAGVLHEGEDPLEGAIREAREEIGVSARRFIQLADFFLAPGYSSELMFAFLAQDFSSDPLPPDEDEFLTIEKIPGNEIRSLIQKKELRDSKTLAVLFLALPFIPGLSRQ